LSRTPSASRRERGAARRVNATEGGQRKFRVFTLASAENVRPFLFFYFDLDPLFLLPDEDEEEDEDEPSPEVKSDNTLVIPVGLEVASGSTPIRMEA